MPRGSTHYRVPLSTSYRSRDVEYDIGPDSIFFIVIIITITNIINLLSPEKASNGRIHWIVRANIVIVINGKSGNSCASLIDNILVN